MMQQEIHFCTAPDGVNIAYSLSGTGPPLVLAASYLRHLEFDWQSPVWRHWHQELGRRHRLLRYDERGTGLSDRQVDDLSFEAWVGDLETVVETAGLERFTLMGMSQAGPVCVAYSAKHAEKVERLILFGTYARGWLKRKLTAEQLEEEQLLLSMMRVGWGRDNAAFRQFFTLQIMPDATREQLTWFDDLMRASASPENAVRLEQEMHEIDVSELAPKVRSPTLIVHSRHDLTVPFDEGRWLAQTIARSEFVSLETRNHLLKEDEPAWGRFVQAFRRFTGAPEDEFEATTDARDDTSASAVRAVTDPAQGEGAPMFAAVLFTDIVQSTRQQRIYGDQRWREALNLLNADMARLSAAHGGRVIKSTGDGVMVVFPTPGRALHASWELIEAARVLDLELRVGIHAGEVLEIDGDMVGAVVTIAARVTERAEAGEVLTTTVVQGLVEGSGLQFADHGRFELKGIGDRRLVRLIQEQAT